MEEEWDCSDVRCDSEGRVLKDGDGAGAGWISGEVTVKDVPQMRGEGRWRLPVPSRIADLKEEIKELKEENASLKERIARCEGALFFGMHSNLEQPVKWK